jgi:hypothetical protein
MRREGRTGVSEAPTVIRWTSDTAVTSERGGFVAYGDYLTLYREFKQAADALDRVTREKEIIASDTAAKMQAVIDIVMGQKKNAKQRAQAAESEVERLRRDGDTYKTMVTYHLERIGAAHSAAEVVHWIAKLRERHNAALEPK